VVSELLAETNILTMISQILQQQDNSHSLVRYLKLEATWILTNICFGDENAILQVFADQYGFVAHINSILNSSDLHMIDQVYFLINNIMCTSSEMLVMAYRKFKLAETIINNMNLML